MQTILCDCWLLLLFCLCKSMHVVNLITATPEDTAEWYDKYSNMELWFVQLWRRAGTEIGFQIDIHIALG